VIHRNLLPSLCLPLRHSILQPLNENLHKTCRPCVDVKEWRGIRTAISREGAKNRKTEDAKRTVVFFAPLVFLFFAPLREIARSSPCF
jgi:hypothetical protein